MTKQDILSKALQQFKQYGIKSVSMNDIAQGLGISKKTLYTHFADKEDLLISCLDEALVSFNSRANHIKENAVNPVAAVLGIYHLSVDELCGYCSAFMYDAHRLYYTNERNEWFKKHLAVTYIVPLLEEARQQQLIHPDTDLDMFCTIVYYMIEGFILDSQFEGPKDKEYVFRHIIAFPVRGILSPLYTAQYGEIV